MLMPSIFGENLFDDFGFPFEDAFFGRKTPAIGKPGKNMLMKTDVKELEHGYELDIDLPGYTKDEITAQLENGYLTVQAEKNVNNDEKGEDGKYIRRERYSGSMRRTFYVGDKISDDQIHAKFENGILHLEVPKEDPKAIEETKKQIAIEG